MTASQAWKGVSLGVFLLAIAVILQSPTITWHWILPVMAGMSFLNAVLKGSWRFAIHPLVWCAGLSWAILSPTLTRWPAIFGLCGISIILAFLIGRIPHRRRPAAVPPRPGDGVIIDVEVTKRSTDH
jgi:hypothetical protein